MTPGEAIVQKHFGDSAPSFRHIVIDIDRAVREKESIIELLSEDCARLRRELDDANGVIR